MSDNLAQPFELAVAGRQLFFDRTLDLLRRVESVTGPVRPFAERFERGNVTSAEAARVYNALVRDDPDGPTAADIDAWIFAEGLFCHQKCAAFLFSLVCGSEALAREAMRIAREGSRANGDGRGPFAKTA